MISDPDNGPRRRARARPPAVRLRRARDGTTDLRISLPGAIVISVTLLVALAVVVLIVPDLIPDVFASLPRRREKSR